jgi:hypothetical protein
MIHVVKMLQWGVLEISNAAMENPCHPATTGLQFRDVDSLVFDEWDAGSS